MTLAQIMKLALRQLDEDPQDISEHDELLRTYANAGYQIAVNEYLKPREWLDWTTDEKGVARFSPREVARVVEVRLEENGMNREIGFQLTADGGAIRTGVSMREVRALCEMHRPDMEKDTDEPRLPESVHAALADYVCYRHLMNGNLAKQNRAKAYLQSFFAALRAMKPDGYGSVTRIKGLYEATNVRYGGR